MARKKTETTETVEKKEEVIEPVEAPVPETPVAPTFTQEQVEAMIAKALADARAEEKSEKTVVVAPEERVTLVFIGGIASGTSVNLGNLGKINRDGGVIEVPKKDFLAGVSVAVDSLLAERKLIVLDGLDEAERERYGVLYKENEVLTVNAYHKLFDYDIATLSEIFSKLCNEQKKIVAKVFYTAFSEPENPNHGKITIEKCRALNEISKQTVGEGLFSYILDDMGRELSK